MSIKILKCLLSFETKHHVIYLKNDDNSTDFITFNQFKDNLINQYQELIKELNLEFIDFNKLQFEIYDLDFQQFVIVDKWTQIKNLSKLKIINLKNDNNNSNSNSNLIGLNKNAFNNNELIENNNFKINDNNLNLSNNFNQSNNSNYLVNSTTLIKQNNFNQFDNSLNNNNNSNNLNKSNQLNNSITSINSNIQQQESKSLNNSTNCTITSNHEQNTVINNSIPFNQLNKLRNSLTSSFKVPNKLLNNNSQQRSKSLNNSTNCTAISSNHEQQKNNSIHSLIAFSKSINQSKTIKIDNKLFKSVECQTMDNEKRIIHLKDNPFKENCIKFKDDYYKLIEENKRLLAKLELYKQGSVANATNYLDDFVYNADEIEKLKKELKEAKDQQKTIMEAYKKKSKEFRRVVYLLTGFKFDALEQRKYRVSHIYSNPNDYLFFTFEKESEIINLLGNEFSEKFYDLINKYLKEFDSYPSFFASITLKLWQLKQIRSENSI